MIDAISTAKRLRYIEQGEPGYTRQRNGERWSYFTVDGKPIRSAKTIDRLNRLALPPAYTDAWYARDAHAHVQATGIDQKGRKQYRYHDAFRAAQEAAKYDGCIDFGAALPKIRKQVECDLARRDLSKDRVVAAVVRLLDLGSVRVGNASYAKANRSYGATTLRNRHVQLKGARLMLSYVGKSGKSQNISVEDARLARVVRQCHDLPGQTLFQYLNSDGEGQAVTSSDVNNYLRALSGDFTAKHFRTWSASVLAFDYLLQSRGETSLKDMLLTVSAKLGNTPAIARKSYVHPALIESVREGAMIQGPLPRATRYLSGTERGFMRFLTAI